MYNHSLVHCTLVPSNHLYSHPIRHTLLIFWQLFFKEPHLHTSDFSHKPLRPFFITLVFTKTLPKTHAACHTPNILVFYQGAVDPLATPTLPSSPQLHIQYLYQHHSNLHTISSNHNLRM